MKRAYLEDHQFDDDAMPCICNVCSGWFDLCDGMPNPRKDNEVICEGCAADIQDAEYTIIEARKRLDELKYKPK